MKNGSRIRVAVGALAVGAFLLSCAAAGSGGGSDPGTPVSVSGPITRGSIIVGGITFDDSNVDVSADEIARTTAYLENGMTVRLRGTINPDGVTGVATAVEVENELRGPVTSIDAGSETFDVLGFTVVVSGDTVYDDGESFATLAVSDVVEIHGFQLGDGRVRATRVDELDPDEEIEVRGVISAVTAGTFQVGAGTATFTYDGTTQIEGGTAIAVGDLIEAELDSSLFALVIEVVAAEDAEYYDEDEAEVEGVVTGFVDVSTPFFVGSTRVQLAADADFDGGDPENLRDGLIVEVEGGYSGTTLLADEVSFEDNVALVGAADAAGAAGVLGVPVSVSSLTELEGLTDVATIALGDPLSIEGYVLPDGSVEALSIELLSGPVAIDEHVLQGPVTAVTGASTVEVLGVSVDLSAATELTDDGGPTLSVADFVALLDVGTVVEIEGSLAGATFSALEAEID